MSCYSNILAAAVLLLGLMVTGCAPASSGAIATAPIPVTVSHPIERTVGDYADFTSRTAAVESVEVRARVSGYIDDVKFTEGKLVKKGDILFEIDPRTYQAQFEVAKGQVERLEGERQLVDLEVDRLTKLVAKGASAQQELDTALSKKAQNLGALATAKAQVVYADLNMNFCTVTAPISGRVGRIIVTVGNLVQSGDQAGGTLLTTIVSVDPIYAFADVDERTVLHVRELIREGKAHSARDKTLHVRLGLANETGFPREGVVNFVDNQVNPKTGTLRIRAVFPNKDEFLTPGLFARLRIPIGEPHEALLVTDRAIDTDQGQRIVYVIDSDNKVDARPVRLGAVHDGMRVIDSGLSTSDRIIVNGLLRVRPGVTVDPKLVEMPGGAAMSETPAGATPANEKPASEAADSSSEQQSR